MKLKNHSQKVPSTTSQKVDTNQKISQTFVRLALVLGISAVLVPVANAFPIGQSSYPHPGGWKIAETSNYGATKGLPYKNVHIYQLHNEQTYVQLVDFSQGGHIRLEQVSDQPIGNFKGWKRQSMDAWWRLHGNYTSRVSMVNAQFFNHNSSPNTTFSFGIRANGRVLDEGGDVNANGGFPLKQMNFYSNRVEVINWHARSLYDTIAPDAIVGKSMRSREKPDASIGRTYLCAKPMNASGNSSYVLLVYTAQAKTQHWAESDLNSWGCNDSNTVMMDGSESTKLRTKGGINMEGKPEYDFIRGYGERLVPQVITIFN